MGILHSNVGLSKGKLPLANFPGELPTARDWHLGGRNHLTSLLEFRENFPSGCETNVTNIWCMCVLKKIQKYTYIHRNLQQYHAYTPFKCILNNTQKSDFHTCCLLKLSRWWYLRLYQSFLDPWTVVPKQFSYIMQWNTMYQRSVDVVGMKCFRVRPC